jgi:hypothetical protein
MSYGRSNYRRGGYRAASRPITPGRASRVNARPDDCRDCGAMVAAGTGQLYRETSGAWSVVHVAAEWSGSPVSGQYVGGCPCYTDRQNEEGHFGRDGHAVSETDRLAAMARTYAAGHPAPRQAGPDDDLREVSRRAGSKYAYTSTGARMTMSSQRCEDAPCCGCCD